MGFSIGYDLIVKDDDMSSLCGCYSELSQRFEEKLLAYSSSLDHVINAAIKSGKTAQNLLLFKNTVDTLKGEASELADVASSCVSSFVSDTDSADSYLY